MDDFARLPRLLTALAVTLSALAAVAQTAPISDAERARRDAEKVFSFIKFHTVPGKPAAEPAGKPSRQAAVSPERPAQAARPADAVVPTATAPAAEQAPTRTESRPAPAIAHTAPATPLELPARPLPAAPVLTAAPAVAASVEPAAPTFQAEPEPEPEDRDEVPLQMVNFVPPVLTQAVQATLGAGSRQVKVRFTVEPSGQVSHAEAAAGVPRRLAKPATEAILQWQFAPLPQARTVDVEIAFKRD